jgi:KDO2-lipid IV(A) lauroyltransferase
MYSIFYALFYLISLIPWPVIYLLSDGVAFLLRKILKYRLEVVHHNLAIAFPNKTIQERIKLQKIFTKNLQIHFLRPLS